MRYACGVMPKILYKVTLTKAERERLAAMTTTGRHSAQSILNALILLNCDAGVLQESPRSGAEIASVLRISQRKIDRVKERFVEHGIEAALNKQVPDRPDKRKVDGDLEAHLVALACGRPPEGRAAWTLRLLAGKAVELNCAESLSHETVRQLLKKRNQALVKSAVGHSTGKKR